MTGSGAAPLDIEGLLDLILASAGRLFEGQGGSIMLRASDTEFEVVAVIENPAALGARVREGEGVAGKVAESRRGVVMTGRGAKRDKPVDHALSVPMLHDGLLFGVLNINAIPGRAYGDFDLEAATQFAAAAGSALAEGRSYEEARAAGEADPSAHLTAMLEHIRSGTQIDYTSLTGKDTVDVGVAARSVSEAMNTRDMPIDVRGPMHLNARARAPAVRRVLTELAENGLRHGAEPVRITIDGNDSVVVLTITDGGKGIPRADRQRVFEPFVRLDDAADKPGIGLGLSIVRQVIDRMGGRIEFVDLQGGAMAARVMFRPA